MTGTATMRAYITTLTGTGSLSGIMKTLYAISRKSAVKDNILLNLAAISPLTSSLNTSGTKNMTKMAMIMTALSSGILRTLLKILTMTAEMFSLLRDLFKLNQQHIIGVHSQHIILTPMLSPALTPTMYASLTRTADRF